MRRAEDRTVVEATATDRVATHAPLPIAPLDNCQRLACLRLIRSENIGAVSFRELINRFGGAGQALDAIPDLLSRASGRRNVRICPADAAEAELDAAQRAGMTPLFTIEPGYPAALARITAPPPLVYVKGSTALLNRHAAAIVGSRDASANGHALARQLASGLAASGLVIVSGLARGIDAAAHRAALATGTVAVVAGGLDVVYPPEHAKLQAEIAEQGCLVGEMPPGFKPRGQDFPRRNRLIAGLSLAVVVVEAARRSGTLITARFAGELGREVCAVPGHPLDPRAEGTNQLLKDGATLVTSAEDVMTALAPQIAHDPDLLLRGLRETGPLSPGPLFEDVLPSERTPAADDLLRARQQVLAVLGPAPAAVDEVARAAGLPSRDVAVALLDLTLAGMIETHGGQLVSLRPGAGSTVGTGTED